MSSQNLEALAAARNTNKQCPQCPQVHIIINCEGNTTSGPTGPTAAIASLSAAKHYKLKTIAEDIEDSASNTTRFLMLGRTSPHPSGDDKTSLIMAAHHESGALYNLLEPFSRLGINMSKFESRPARGKLGEYLFFVDIDGHQKEKKVSEALKEVDKRASFLKVFGSYPKAVA